MVPKLFKVTYEIDILVAAENEKVARKVADRNIGNEIHNQDMFWCQTDAREILTKDDVPDMWQDGLVYHAGKEELTVESFFKTPEKVTK